MEQEPTPPERLQFGPLLIDQRSRVVTVDGQPVPLTTSEYALLLTLATHQGRAISSRNLLRAMWDTEWSADTSALQVHASRLRRKLGESGAKPHFIQTVHGYGYRFDADMDGGHADGWVSDPVHSSEWSSSGPTVAYCVVATDRVIQWLSPTVEPVLGWQAAQLIGRNIYDLVHPEDRIAAFAARDDLDAGRPTAFVQRLESATGDYRPFAVSIHPILGPDGKAIAFASEWQLRAALEEALGPDGESSLQDGAARHRTVELHLDHEFILRKVVPMQPFLIWDPRDILGKYFSPTGTDPATVRSVVDFLISAGDFEVDGKIPMKHLDGDTHEVRVRTRLLVSDDGVFRGLHSTMYLPIDGS